MPRANLLVTLLLLLAGGGAVRGQETGSPWIMSQLRIGTGKLADERVMAIRPEVHSVKSDSEVIEIRSAGISLYYFGPLQTPVDPVERMRRLRFRIPVRPALNDGEPVRVRPEVSGLFVTGMPIHDLNSPRSYRGQNIWHFDQLAINDDGSLVAAGRPRAELLHSNSSGLLAPLIGGSGHHSPIIGFAFDGYPIYGPWGYQNPDGSGGLRRMRSGYRRREISNREELPDGTRLTPGQRGPDVDQEYPLGSFVEDYHFSPGRGDLDRFNGRWTVTPEYPQGTYAYFLTTDEAGRLAFPYLLGDHYRGRISRDQLANAFLDEAERQEPPLGGEITRQNERLIPALTPPDGFVLKLRTSSSRLVAGQPLRLSFEPLSPQGKPIRALEQVHEKPLHLLVVSADLAEFTHLHPAPAAGDRYEIVHQFANGGRYRLYADYTPPGGPQQIASFLLEVTPTKAARRSRQRLTRAGPVEQAQGELRLRLAPLGELRAGEETEFRLQIRDRQGGLPPGREPFLGAWAHFVVIDPAHR
ncbi:MAG: YHYH protein, partial [Acidobacteriota bacterium]